MYSTLQIMDYRPDSITASSKKQFSFAQAKQIGDRLGISWEEFGIEQFRMGLNVELEHGGSDPATDVTHDDPIMTGKIALAHLNEMPDYYTQLSAMEQEAEQENGSEQRGDFWEVRSTEKNKLGVLLSVVVFIGMLILKVWQASRPSTSTTVGLRHGSPPR